VLNHKLCRRVSAVSLAAVSCVVGQDPGTGEIRFVRDGEALFVSSVDVATALELEAKVVTPNRLLTFCREGDAGYCIPVQLNPANHRVVDETLMLDAALVSRALSCRFNANDNEITVVKLGNSRQAESEFDVASYNATWPVGRGFRDGETLPNIPLVDLQGDEIRFSQFLGTRYILYCWASW